MWVHIADVSAFVRPGAAVDLEAYRRGTSVYVPGAVEPMLPEALSNRACSLVPGAERLAVTVEMELMGERARSVSFYRSLIRSDARLTYDRVDLIFANGAVAARAAKAATLTIPIVFTVVPDPVASGLVNDLAKPDGNITGVSSLTTDLVPKRIEILKALAPSVS